MLARQKFKLYFLFLFSLKIVRSQFNFHYSNEINDNTNALQYNCLRLIDYGYNMPYSILWYCMNEFSTKFDIDITDKYESFTFAQLSSQNITSKDLYDWSSSIDIAEQYQFYLNQLSQSIDDTNLANNIFYNCTWPTFGFKCQYKFDYLFFHNRSVSLWRLMNDFYYFYGFDYELNYLTCYTHLECDRGPLPACLDWTEICDGRIDCRNEGIDEKYCWQLEINQCKEHEYRCPNGQCIILVDSPTDTFRKGCLDAWDRSMIVSAKQSCNENSIPSSHCEDSRCTRASFTSSCPLSRINILKNILYSDKNLSVSSNCSSAFQYVFNTHTDFCNRPEDFCRLAAYIDTINKNCPSMMIYPNRSIFMDFVFVYSTNFSLDSIFQKPYICYTNNYYNNYFSHIFKIFFENMTCINSNIFLNESMDILFQGIEPNHKIIEYLQLTLEKYHHPWNSSSFLCNQSNVYHCMNSNKCISIYRLLDTVYDCPYSDDENIDLINHTILNEQTMKNYLKCQISNKYVHVNLIKNNFCECDYNENNLCEDEYLESNYTKNDMLFQTICDRIIDIFSVYDNNKQNLTDETNCEQWECNNMYTRCDHIWNCPNGLDEIGCQFYYTSYSLNCSSKELLCGSIETNQLICLPFQRINDGKIDCLGGMDELTPCRINSHGNMQYKFYCKYKSSYLCLDFLNLCDGIEQCTDKTDERFCTTNQSLFSPGMTCTSVAGVHMSDIERLLCRHHQPRFYSFTKSFRIDRTSISINVEKKKKSENSLDLSVKSISEKPHCHRGIDLRVSLNRACLCPPMYYGSRCQYQNQRISLSIQFRAFSDSWKTIFEIVILLIDDSQPSIIHSYEKFSYLPIQQCGLVFNFYLLYANRSKDQTKNYFIQINFYEKKSLNYRGSALYSVDFVFLPVHRLTYLVDIPSTNDKNRTCSNRKCVHGKCIRYNNYPYNQSFCHCDEGWSGEYCTIQLNCLCSSNSRCIGISASNHSICACSMDTFGSRCLLNDAVCEINNNSMCKNNGQCVSLPYNPVDNVNHMCICPKGFHGVQCEKNDIKLILSFEEDIVVSPVLFVHFINQEETKPFQRSTTFGTFNQNEKSVVIFWPESYILLFVELLDKKYYLADIQYDSNRSTIINKTINSFNRCPNISELFNEIIYQSHILRRIKSYHLPCQNLSLNLSCFHDEMHICLCYLFEGKRLSNCFQFDHQMTFNCFGTSECEHDGQCFQDNKNCPKRSVCLCESCYYGTRCQFQTSGFGLSLDAILGYHIEPDVNLIQQSAIILFSLSLTIVFVVGGLFDGSLCFITFQNKVVRDVGCGIYLLCSSVITILISILLMLKFSIFLCAQMKMIVNRSFLEIQCYSLDFLIRLCLCFDQWLTACVAVERTFTVAEKARFNKKKSRQTAKYVIIVLLIVLIGSSIQDPLHRRLIDERNDENDEIKRTWCIITYPSKYLQQFNSYMQIFHFLIPFTINFVSAILLITIKSRQRLRIYKNRTYFQIIHEQYQDHKHLLIAPIVLVLLALPRLILTFTSECMQSSNDAWLYIILYLISFIPSMLTFIVFISPSKFYKKEFQNTLARYRTIIRRSLHFNF